MREPPLKDGEDGLERESDEIPSNAKDRSSAYDSRPNARCP
jgi:hypothetical protein